MKEEFDAMIETAWRERRIRFTRGPWMQETDQHGKIRIGSRDGLQLVATIHPRFANAEANARLIEMAPDLFSACEDMLDVLSECEQGFIMEHLPRIAQTLHVIQAAQGIVSPEDARTPDGPEDA